MTQTANLHPSRANAHPPRTAGANVAQALTDSVTDKRLSILRGVAETGSISEAARQAKVSYKSAWQAIETLTQLAGAVLVEKMVGGMGGGGARLTTAGEGLLQSAQQWQQLQRHWFTNQQMPPMGMAMQTSMRNQWPVTVKACSLTEGRVRVALYFADEQILWAQITPESQQQLAIEPGAHVIAMCKANAVGVRRIKTVVASGEPLSTAANQFEGRLSGLDAKASVSTGDALTVTLASGISLIGYWRDVYSVVDGPVAIEIDESAVVIAIAIAR